MSCDHSRGVYFAHLARTGIGAYVGGASTAEALLHTVYDVAASQPVPADKAATLAAKAATRKLKALATKERIDLYPHESKSGLPSPEAQQGWLAVSETVAALQNRTPLPPLAQDALGGLAFAGLVAAPRDAWQTPVQGATRLALRRAWAANPFLIRQLVAAPEHLAAALPPGWVAGLTMEVATDPAAPPSLKAAARHYLALDEAEALEPGMVGQWAQVLAAVGGVGVGSGACPRCGVAQQSSIHQCHPEYQGTLPELAVAVARALAEPINAGEHPDPTPRSTLSRLLRPAEIQDDLRSSDEPLASLLEAARLADRADLTNLRGFTQEQMCARLREMTIRTPLQIDGERYVWDNNRLIAEADYRAQADWMRHGTEAASLLPDTLPHPPLAHLGWVDLRSILSGQRYAPTMIRWRNDMLTRKFDTMTVRAADLNRHHVIVAACGCALRRRPSTDGKEMVLVRIAFPADRFECSTHNRAELPEVSSLPSKVECIDPSRPLFAPPVWPNPAPVAEGGA